MADILNDENEIERVAEGEDGMLIIFPDENDDAQEEHDAEKTDDDIEESFSLSFGKVNAARKEEEFSFMPFLNIPDVADEEEEEEDDDGEGFSLSFGKVSAAKKEKDYVYLPFLNVDENAVEETETEDAEEEDDDSGIDIVGGDELFDLTPLKTRDTGSVSRQTSKSREPEKNTKTINSNKKQPPKKGKIGQQQKKKAPQKNAAPQKPNKVQQILAQMDPDIIASVSSDPRQMMMLEETIRSELIKQAAHNAVARELSSDVVEIEEAAKKRQQPVNKKNNAGRQRPQHQQQSSLEFTKSRVPQKKNKPISIVDTSTISEFGVETPAAAPVVPPVPQASQPAAQNVVQQTSTQVPSQPTIQQMPNISSAAPVITQPVIVQTPPAAAQTQQQTQSTASNTSSTSAAPRKAYTPTSPAAIRAAMKSGALSFDSPSSSSNNSDSSPDSSPSSVQKRKRMEIQKQISEKRSGCVIGAIALLMVIFIAIIALISGGDIMTQCNNNEKYMQAEELAQQGKYEEAIEILSGIQDYSQTGQLLNECYYTLGKEAQDKGDYDTAIAYYDKTLDYDVAIRSRLELQIMKADEYRASADKSKSADEYYNAYALYGVILKDYESNPDIADSNVIKEIQNKSNSTQFEYAKLLFENGSYDLAKPSFESLKDASYSEAETWYYKTCFMLGYSYYKSGNYLSAADELKYFESGNHGLDDKSYYNAVACLAISRLYSGSDNETNYNDIQYMQNLFSLFTEAYEGKADSDLLEKVKEAMASDVFDTVKLIGSWKNDDGNYIIYENGKIFFYISNEVSGNLSEIVSNNVVCSKGEVSIENNGKEYIIMKDISFESTYQMSPQTLVFVNPYDGLTYKMFRNRQI